MTGGFCAHGAEGGYCYDCYCEEQMALEEYMDWQDQEHERREAEWEADNE